MGMVETQVRDVLGCVLRQRSVGIVGAQRPWEEVSDSRREMWRAAADPYCIALSGAGIQFAAHRDADLIDATGRQRWTVGCHSIVVSRDTGRAEVLLDDEPAPLGVVVQYAEALLSAAREFETSDSAAGA
jgi:hypothetical protein